MFQIRIAMMLSFSALAPGVLAHPGHAALDPNHAHGSFAAGPIGASLLAIAAVAVALVVRAGVRRRQNAQLRLNK